jgi:hypothetical protein
MAIQTHSTSVPAIPFIEIGKDLLEVKGSIGHGKFLPWIEAEFGMGQTTAYRFMDVAKVYEGKLTIVGSLDHTALYELAAPKTPIEVREEIERMIEAGEGGSALRSIEQVQS